MKRTAALPSTPAEPDLARAEKLLLRMLAIPGVSTHEGRIMEFIRRKLIQAGANESDLVSDDAHQRSPFGGEVGNLVFKLPGTVRGKRRLFLAHVDTVPICRGAQPVVEGDIVRPASPATGLGGDDRAGSTVVLTTALEILRRGLPHPPLVFCWTVQEELGLCGTRYGRVGLLGRPALAFNFDGGFADRITLGATGGYRMTIRIHGLASHAGGAPEKGVSAIAIAAMAIARLQAEGWHGRIEKNGRTGTSNVGVIHGGEATNVVTPYVELYVEARSHDPAFRAEIVETIQRAFREAAVQVTNHEGVSGRVEVDGHLDYEAFALASDEPCVVAAREAVASLGLEPELLVSNGGLDANWLSARGIPTVSLGGGQQNPHTPAERLDLVHFRHACRVALRLATESR